MTHAVHTATAVILGHRPRSPPVDLPKPLVTQSFPITFFQVAPGTSRAVPLLDPFLPPSLCLARPTSDSSLSSRPAPRGLRCSAERRPSPEPTESASAPHPPRRQPSPTSGYRLQPPRLWHYGHGGGDGSAEEEQAGH